MNALHRMSLLLACGTIVAGCSSGRSLPAARPASARPEQVALDSAVARWHRAGLTNYRFKSDLSCFCKTEVIQPMTVTVQQGQVTSVVDRGTGAVRPLSSPASIDSVLARVGVELRDPRATVEVTYDQVLGYPRRFSVSRKNVEDADFTVALDSVVKLP